MGFSFHAQIAGSNIIRTKGSVPVFVNMFDGTGYIIAGASDQSEYSLPFVTDKDNESVYIFTRSEEKGSTLIVTTAP